MVSKKVCHIDKFVLTSFRVLILSYFQIAAGGWHSAVISEFNDLYMFGWNESGQLALPTNLARPAECFSAVEKLLMACCTMQAEDAALPRGDTEDTEVYRKHGDEDSECQIIDPDKVLILVVHAQHYVIF